MKPLTIVILTFNEEKNIKACLDSLANLDAPIFAVDSYSTDQTLSIYEEYNIPFVQHPFENYSAQRNWAQSNIPWPSEWVFHLDAGERLTPELVEWINQSFNPSAKVNGYMFSRRTMFMGKWIRYGAHYPNYHLRLYRKTKGKCEDKVYDQHFVVDGEKTVISSGIDIIDTVCDNLKDFMSSHLRWAVFEAVEVVYEAQSKGDVKPSILGNPIERKRWLKNNIFQKVPKFYRSIFYFFYRYFLRLGFLDGTAGFIFHFLQGLWFRMIVDSMVYEIEQELKNGHSLDSIVKNKYQFNIEVFMGKTVSTE